MGSHLDRKHLSKEFVLRKTFPLGKVCGMIVSRRKLGWRQRATNREVTVTMP
jgi:hypothetical protein